MVLEGLRLPVDIFDPFAEARLTRPEREHLLALIDARIETRQPASYLLGAAYQNGLRFIVDRNVLIPRSFIGDILRDGVLSGDDGLIATPITRILDLCTGSGCLAILASINFMDAHVDAVDISAAALDVARRNVKAHGQDAWIKLYKGDLFAPLGQQTYDLIITNPPYVDRKAMAALPPEYRHEPSLALAGGKDGLSIIRTIMAEAGKHLTRKGGLLCEVGSGRDLVEATWPDMPFLWLDTELSEGEVFFLPAKALR
jgi:ribosomal protein L3 glutamine methyltransferase